MKTSFKNILAVSLVVPSLLVMTGCARNINSGNYASASVGEAMTSYIGTIISKRTVSLQAGDSLGDNTAGIAAGGVGGALLGSTIGGGNGSLIAAVGGAALGALAGGLAQQELSKQNGFEYTIQIDKTGELKTLVQGMDVDLAQGARVIIHLPKSGVWNRHSASSRARIAPFNG